MKLQEHLKLPLLMQHLRDGYVTCQSHPTLPYYIYNYTPKAQFEQKWDEVTTKCRGLVVDSGKNVIAMGFPKFHNVNTAGIKETSIEYLESLGVKPRVYEKLDGSMGILFRHPLIGSNTPIIATRGSFSSKQAKWATEWYKDNVHSQYAWNWPSGYTPIFEIIMRDDRKVVEYDFEGLVLLAVRHPDSGDEVGPADLEYYAALHHVRVAKAYQNKPINELIAENTPNREGYVLTYPIKKGWSNEFLRVKVKFAEYVRLHKLLTGWNIKSVWELLANGKAQDITDLLNDKTLPEDFRKWLKESSDKLQQEFTSFEWQAIDTINTIKAKLNPSGGEISNSLRKKFAEAIKKQDEKYVPALFMLLDGQNPSEYIWKTIKPKIEPGNEILVDGDESS